MWEQITSKSNGLSSLSPSKLPLCRIVSVSRYPHCQTHPSQMILHQSLDTDLKDHGEGGGQHHASGHCLIPRASWEVWPDTFLMFICPIFYCLQLLPCFLRSVCWSLLDNFLPPKDQANKRPATPPMNIDKVDKVPLYLYTGLYMQNGMEFNANLEVWTGLQLVLPPD